MEPPKMDKLFGVDTNDWHGLLVQAYNRGVTIKELLDTVYNEAIEDVAKKADSMASFDGNAALGASEIRGMKRAKG